MHSASWRGGDAAARGACAHVEERKWQHQRLTRKSGKRLRVRQDWSARIAGRRTRLLSASIAPRLANRDGHEEREDSKERRNLTTSFPFLDCTQ
jgi:hypothetical protein